MARSRPCAREQPAEDAAAVHGEGGQQVEEAEEDVEAAQVRDGEARSEAARRGQQRHERQEHRAQHHARQRPHERHEDLVPVAPGQLGDFGHAADDHQRDGAHLASGAQRIEDVGQLVEEHGGEQAHGDAEPPEEGLRSRQLWDDMGGAGGLADHVPVDEGEQRQRQEEGVVEADGDAPERGHLERPSRAAHHHLHGDSGPGEKLRPAAMGSTLRGRASLAARASLRAARAAAPPAEQAVRPRARGFVELPLLELHRALALPKRPLPRGTTSA